MAKSKPIFTLDFDGVLHSYESGWQGAHVISDPPVRGAIKALIQYTEHFKVNIYSARSHQDGGIEAMQAWLRDHLMRYFVERCTRLSEAITDTDAVLSRIEFPTHKPAASVSLDDRAITFTGEWPTVERLLNFKPWNK